MGIENILGSPTALSLASTTDLPMTIVGLAAGGVMISVASAVFVYEKYELFEEKKHRKAIEEINRLHKRYLERIVIPGYDDIQGFPALFKLTSNENSSAADSLHFTDDEINDIGKNLPHGADIALSPYRETVLSTLLKLKEYYFLKMNEFHFSKDDDLTTSVLSYLLYILSTKCLNFQGYEYDIAYLDAISQFVNAYASISGVNSQHFSRLQPVYSYLLTAKKYLEKHRETLSLEELLAELRDSCSNASNKLIRNLVKMTIDQNHAPLAETVSLYELQKNILRRRYINTHIKGIELCTDAELHLPDSVFKEWIISLTQYYLKSLRPISSIRDNDIVAPDDLFHFIPWAKAIMDEQDRSKIDSIEVKKLEKSFNKIRSVFKNSPNFINTELDPSSKKPRFITITEGTAVLNRTTVLSDFARLIHSIISMQLLCTHLLKSIKQLGDIYAKDPSHFREIFAALNQLFAIIKNGVKLNLNAFSEIEHANQNVMRLDKDELFSRDIVATLKTVKQMTANLGMQVIEYRNKCAKPTDPTEASINYDMITVANLISKMYFQVEQQPPDCSIKNTEAHPTPSEAQATDCGIPDLKSNDNELIKEGLYHLTTQIFYKLGLIQQESLQDPRFNQYRTIYHTLNSMQAKSITLMNEPEKESDRREKAQKTSALTHSLCQKTLDFLSLKKEDRDLKATDFIQQIHNELAHPKNNAFIDKHSNNAPQFIYTNLCSLGLFRTETRKRLSQFEQACDGLTGSI